MKTRYDWLTSRDAFEVFKEIYLTKKVSLKEICSILDKKKSNVSEQIIAFRNQGLIDEEVIKKEKYFSINNTKLAKVIALPTVIGVSNEQMIMAAVLLAGNFEHLKRIVKLMFEKDKNKFLTIFLENNLKIREAITQQEQAIIYGRVVKPLYEKLGNLQKENSKLKADIAKKN